MEKRKFIKKLEKNIGIKKQKSVINSLNAAILFMAFMVFYAIYMNHSGIMLSYGIIVAAVALLIIAGFLSYRIKHQVILNNTRLDYRKFLVKPYAEKYFEKGSFSRSGSLTEREIVSTLLFSDGHEYKYTSCNELKGIYKGVKFANSDMNEYCSNNKFSMNGRIFELDIETKNINPVVFTTATAPILEHNNSRVHLINPKDSNIKKMFRVYAYDENEANALLTDNMIHKLRELVALQLGKVLKISFLSNKVYVFYSTDKTSYEEELTKKHNVEDELKKIEKVFNDVGKLVDIL